MTDTETIEQLWHLGYFRSDKPDVRNVTKADLPKLAINDSVVIQAMQAWQERFRPQLDELVMAYYGRMLIADGVTGPATNLHLTMPRCPCPDFTMTEEDDPDVAKLWNHEEANWPETCRMDLVFGRDFDSLPGLSQAETDGVYHAIANNLTAALSDVDLKPDLDRDPSGARCWDHLERMSGGTLAWNYLAQNNCGVKLTGAWNSNVTWSMQYAATTGTHEKMHWLGANHSNDPTSTIYPSINTASRQRYGYPNDTDISILRALGYKPYANWQNRRPSLDDLYKPRGQPEPPPTPQPGPGGEWPETFELSPTTILLGGKPAIDKDGNEVRYTGRFQRSV